MPRIGEKVTLEFEIPDHCSVYEKEQLGDWDEFAEAGTRLNELMESSAFDELLDFVAWKTHSTAYEVHLLIGGAIATALKILD